MRVAGFPANELDAFRRWPAEGGGVVAQGRQHLPREPLRLDSGRIGKVSADALGDVASRRGGQPADAVDFRGGQPELARDGLAETVPADVDGLDHADLPAAADQQAALGGADVDDYARVLGVGFAEPAGGTPEGARVDVERRDVCAGAVQRIHELIEVLPPRRDEDYLAAAVFILADLAGVDALVVGGIGIES